LNIDYRKIKTGSFTLWLAAPFANSPLQDALADGLRSLSKIYPVKKVPASAASDVCTFAYEGRMFYFKRYHCRSFWDFIKHTVRPSRARRAMQAAAMLEANGFAAPEVVAAGCRDGIFRLENFLLTREVENALPLYTFFKQRYGRPDSRPIEKRKFVRAIGHLVGQLHAKNISHGDLRLGNILVHSSLNQQPAASNQQLVVDFFLLDNERTVQHPRLPNRLRLKNLVQVNMFQPQTVTPTDRLRFFKAYLSENPTLMPVWKSWAAKVHHKTSRRLAKRTPGI
jgi:tRNA A-37 threonylcarbamoyl transferase component Bud32